MRTILAVACSLLLLAVAAPSAQAACPTDTTPDFTDNCYHEYLLYNVDAGEVDVLILPSVDQWTMRDFAVLKASVEAWDTGINNKGAGWLADNLNLHAYLVGVDNVPAAALADPEIIITTGEVNPYLLFGIGLQIPFQFCHGQPWPLMLNTVSTLTEFHEHVGGGMASVECDGGGFTCMVINTNFYTGTPSMDNTRDLYDLNSHELGHCLGIGHVGDANDFKANSYPRDDIMSYESDGWEPNYVLCVSSLNILALKAVYGNMFSQPGYATWPAGGYVHMDPSAWNDDNCVDPPNNPWNDPSPVTGGDLLDSLPLDIPLCLVEALLDSTPMIDCLL